MSSQPFETPVRHPGPVPAAEQPLTPEILESRLARRRRASLRYEAAAWLIAPRATITCRRTRSNAGARPVTA